MGWKKTSALIISLMILLSACTAELTADVNESPSPKQTAVVTPESDPIKDNITATFASFCDTEFIDISSFRDMTIVSIYDKDIAALIQEAKDAGAAPTNWEDIKATLLELSEAVPLLQDTTRCAIYLMASEVGEIYLTVSEGNIMFDIFESIDEVPAEMTLGQKNALEKAVNYLNLMSFSYSGLVNQLEFEGFTANEAAFAADNCAADWNEQAAMKAQEYLDFTSFSRQGLIDQLLFEGFTQAQAEYGVSAVGY